MKLTFLGTGTSQGVPVITCKCDVCKSIDERDKRLRTSALIEVDDVNLVIDSGPDFRQQMLRENVQKLDAILFTHEHKDHTAGLDDVRAFNYSQQKPMMVFCEKRVANSLKQEFAYVFSNFTYPGLPKININCIENKKFMVDNVKVEPIRVKHLKLPVFGYKIGSLAYITDANYISNIEKEKIKGVKVLVINALRRERHLSHFTLQQALDLIAEVKPERAYLTHLSHFMGLFSKIKNELPENVYFAYDGLCIEI